MKKMFLVLALFSSSVSAETPPSPSWMQPQPSVIRYKKDLIPAQYGCCVICTQGKACGNSCIAIWKDCTKVGGCACNG